MAINFSIGFAVVVAAIASPFHCFEPQDSPRAILQQVLKNQRSVDYLHIETRSFGSNSGSAEVKVQTLKGKGIMVTMLKPSFRAGIVTIDDTKVSKTYLPDLDELWIQPSPYLLQPGFDLRWKLINQNYNVKEGRSDTIAGRKVRELVLKPVDEDIPMRRMFVDPKYNVMLRYVVDVEDEGSTVIFDTKYVEFGRAVAEADYGLPSAASEAKVRKFDGPKLVLEPLASKEAAGFSTRFPESLPFGFEVSGAYLFGSGPTAYVVVKLTDGMSTLTVYQWMKGRSKSPTDARFERTDRYGVSFGVAIVPGDMMPSSVLKEIVNAFRGDTK